ERAGMAGARVARAEDIAGVKLVVHRIDGEMKDLLPLSKQLADVSNVVAILGAAGDTASLVVARGNGAKVDAASVLQRVVGLLGGKGGGSPEFAQGAGPKVEALGDAIEAARREVRTLLTASG
ncbi:MAG: DHHA1 domain-containing protein, partial [Candidatus Thermoplasmatota archaeon]